MKKSEFTQLTQIIELLVAKEVRKQLPQVISEVFQNMMGGKSVVAESKQPITEAKEPVVEEEDPLEMKASLRELFSGGAPVTKRHLETGMSPTPRQPKNYVKDPVLNQILNETRPLRETERLAGMAAYQAGYNPAIPPVPVMNMTGVGEMMNESELPSFARNMPDMKMAPQSSPATVPIREGQAPMAALPEGVSALDVARAGMLPQGAAVTEALTNYDRMKKILEASKGKRY